MRPILFALVALVCVPAFAAQRQVIVQKQVQRNGLFRRNVQVDVQKIRVAPVRQQVVVQRVVAPLKVQRVVQVQQIRQHLVQPIVVQQLHAGYAQPLILKQQVNDHCSQQLNGGCNLLGH